MGNGLKRGESGVHCLLLDAASLPLAEHAPANDNRNGFRDVAPQSARTMQPRNAARAATGQALRLALAECGFSGAWLAARCGVSCTLVRYWIAGERNVDAERVERYAPSVFRVWVGLCAAKAA